MEKLYFVVIIPCQCLWDLRRGNISLLHCVHICVCCSLPSLASMGGERGQLSQNIFLDIDFSTTSLAVFLPCYQLWIFLKIIFSCWIVYSVGYLQYSRILQIQYPHQAKIFLLYLQIYHQFLESGLTDMRCSTSFFLGALILRGVNVETSGVFGHHYLNSATVQKPGLQTFGEILSTALIHPLWSDLSLGRL